MKKKQKTSTHLPESKLLLIIAVFGFLLYANTLPNDFNIDDDLVTMNHHITSKGIQAIPEIFSTPYYKDAAGNQYEYRPVTLTSFAIEHQIFGDNAKISHLINTLIYVLLSLILYLTLSKLFNTYNYLLPFTITLLFIAHPIHTEAVASIKNRDELLCFTGGILSFYYSLLYIERSKIKYYFLFIFFFSFALLSKKSILPFAVIIPISHVLFRSVSLTRLFYISLPLSISLAFFWPLNSIYEKIFFALLPITVPPAIYFILYKKQVFVDLIKGTYDGISQVPKALFTGSDINYLSYNSKFQWILLPFSFLLALFFCFNNYKIMIIIYLSLLGFLFLFVPRGSHFRLFYSILIFIATVSYFYWAADFLVLLLTVGLAIYFTGGKKIKDLISLIILILLIGLFFINGIKPVVRLIIFLPLFFFVFYETKKRSISILIFSLLLLFFIFLSPKIILELATYSSAIIVFILLFLHLRPQLIQSRSATFFALLFVPVMIIYFVSNNDQFPQSEIVNKIIKTTSSLERVKIIPAAGRVLNYIEMPLKNSDPLTIKVGTSFTVLAEYFRLLVFPYKLGFYYGYAYIVPVPWTNSLSMFSILIHLILIVTALYFFKKHPIFSYGIFFYLICISEFSNLVVPVAGVMGDRLAFVASAGFCIATGYSLLWIAGTDIKSSAPRFNFTNKALIIIAVLLLYSAKTFSRNFQWKDPVTLMRTDIKHLDKSVQANNLLAFNLVEKGLKSKTQAEKEKYLNEAVIHFKKAVELYPKADFAWHDLGQTYLLLNNLNEALPAFLKAIEIDSTYEKAWMKAGGTYSKLKKYKEAAYCFQKVIINNKNNIQAYNSLSEAYFIQHNYEKAIETNLQALKMDSMAYDPIVNTGKTYFIMGDKKNALLYFEKAYLINPEDRNLVLTMGNIYKELGDQKNADLFFLRANQKNR